MRDTIDMAREAGWKDLRDYDSEMQHDFFMGNTDSLKAFEALVRADERKQIALDKMAENARELGLDYEPWNPNDTAHRPGGLPQDFIKHEVENEGDWSEWVNPKPEQYFMKCCDCGLVHEMQFKVAKYSEGDECEFVADADLQAVFRARRATPPAQPAPVQEPVAWADVDENGAISSLRYWSEPDNRYEVALYPAPPAAVVNQQLATEPAAPIQEPPPECQTEAEKRAYAFGWWKALEANRAAPVQEPVELTDDEIWKFWWNKPEVPEGEDDSMEAQFVSVCREVIKATAQPAPVQEPVANIRTWHKNGEQHAELWNWDKGIEGLPDGEHNLYITPPAQRLEAAEAKLKEKNT
jgi:hypothetical protein